MNYKLLQKAFFRFWNQFEKQLMSLPFLDHPYAQLFQQKQEYFYIGLGFVLCWMSFQFHILPQYQNLQKMKVMHRDLERRINSSQLEKLKAEHKQRELNERLNKARSRLFTPPEALQFSNVTLPKLISDSGCRVDVIQRQPQTQVNELLFQLPLDIRIYGTTQQIALFIKSTRALPQHVGFKNLSLEPQEKKGLQLSTSLVLFYAIP